MNIKRSPFFGGVEYYDEDSKAYSCALYPIGETEHSAQRSNQLEVLVDELNIWSNQDEKVS